MLVITSTTGQETCELRGSTVCYEGERLPSMVALGQESPEIAGSAFIQVMVLGHLGPPQEGGEPIQIL